MIRRVLPELLDTLPPTDPRAVRSRRELRRVNAWMGNARWLSAGLRSRWRHGVDRVVTDLGTGDGWVTWGTLDRVTRREPMETPKRLFLVDQQPVVSGEMLERFRSRGWQPTVVSEDARRALERPEVAGGDVVMANLFLHHFDDDTLGEMLATAAGACRLFAACEPRRSSLGRWGARMLGLIGCRAVTRHDARVSVDAGFLDGEISGLWPGGGGWRKEEGKAGLFSHLFVAWREERGGG